MGCGLRLLIALATNALALWASGRLFSGVSIHGASAYVIGAVVLGLVNGILKPILTIVTLSLVILTLGLFYLLINIGMVALTAWITPNFSVHGFWSYVGTVFIVWLVNWAVSSLLDRGTEAVAVKG
jgi:putative membrane protein